MRRGLKGFSWWATGERCAFAQGTIQQIKLDQLRAVGAYTVHLMVLSAAAALSPLRVTLLLTANTSRTQPPWSPVSPQPASRWALLMSPSRSSSVGLFFPGLEGTGRGQRGSAGWVSTRQGARDGTRKRNTRGRAENHTLQTLLMVSLYLSVGRWSVRALYAKRLCHRVHYETEVHVVLFDLCLL